MAFRCLYRPPAHAVPRHARRSASPQPGSHARSGSHMATAVTQAAAATPLAASQSLVFQLEIDGRDVLRPMPPPPRRELHAVLDRLDALCHPEASFEARLARDARYYHAATLEEEGRADVVILASCLAGVGYDVTIRTALGGGSGVSAFKHLSHEFLVVAGPPDARHAGGAAEYIVDPRFREQFDIPQTVAWYDELLVSVPEAYTGPASRLRALVRLLSGEMGTAFAAAGAVTPPWRSAGALLSKWLPAKARDMHVSDPHLSSASSVPGSPDAGRPPQPSSSVPIAAGFGGGMAFDGAGFGGAVSAAPASHPTFATAGKDLRTTSAPAVTPAGGSTTHVAAVALPDSKQPQQQQTGTAAIAEATVAPAAQGPRPQPEGRSDSEDDHLSSPDTTLAWRTPSGRRGAKPAAPGQPSAASSAGHAAAAPSDVTKSQALIPHLRVSGGGPAGAPPPQPATQPPTAGSAAAAAAQYAAHLQTLPPPRHGTTSAPAVAAAGSDDGSDRPRQISGSLSDTAVDVRHPNPGAGEAQQQQQGSRLRTRSNSALSTKLASAGFISRWAAAELNSATNAASSAAFSKAASQQAISDSPSGGAAPPLPCGTGTLPAGTRLPTSPPDSAASPNPKAPAAAPKQRWPPSREPSVEAPFWDQPLIRDFIATQREQPLPPPPPAINTRAGAAKGGAAAYAQAEPRIRTVKMRGAGGGTHHALPRRMVRT